MDQLAKRGARNLQENLLPAVSDSFIRAGQFGSSRMGDFGSRAVRDTQEAILAQQAELANTGYAQAMANRATDLTRQANLGQTVAGIQQADVARQMGALSDLANLGAQRQALGYTDTAALEAAGAGQQQQMQRELTAAEKQFLDQQNFARQSKLIFYLVKLEGWLRLHLSEQHYGAITGANIFTVTTVTDSRRSCYL